MTKARFRDLLERGEIETVERLAGGVSSDIWKVSARGATFCVKRALPRLRVAAIWEAPVERNRMERLWCETANSVRPGVAPTILAHDDGRLSAGHDCLP